jgi:kinesin family protein 18/19
MLGSYTEPGIMTLTLQELFAKLNAMKDERQFKIKCSFVEVYNENIRDLLGEGKDLDLRQDPVKGMCVAGVSEVCGLEKVEDRHF